MLAEHLFVSSLQCPDMQPPKPPERMLDCIEKNAVRYAAGFIVRKLRRRFDKSSTKMSARLVQCLNQMLYDPTDLDQPENADVEVDDFEVYTKIWLKKTNIE